jgi:hypothetical protein
MTSREDYSIIHTHTHTYIYTHAHTHTHRLLTTEYESIKASRLALERENKAMQEQHEMNKREIAELST